MKSLLVLPNITLNMPEVFSGLTCERLSLNEAEMANAVLLSEKLNNLQTSPLYVVGSVHTPTLVWLSAIKHFPFARMIVEGASNAAEWVDFVSGEVIPQALTAAQTDENEPERVEETVPELQMVVEAESPAVNAVQKGESASAREKTTESAQEKKTESAKETTSAPAHEQTAATTPGAAPATEAVVVTKKAKKQNNTIAAMKVNELSQKAFLHSVWEPSAENERMVAMIKAEAAKREVLQPGSVKQINAGIKKAARARALWADVESARLKMGHTPEFDQWLEGQLKSENWLVKNHIKLSLRKLQERKVVQKAKEGVWRSRLPEVNVSEGVHPSSLRHLPVHDQWEVIIDETGDLFGSDVARLSSQTRSNPGKVVALIVPKGKVKFKSLRAGFHATSAAPGEVDKALAEVLQQPVGVLGFSVLDSDINVNTTWLGAIESLMKWVLRLLPFDAESTTTVEFFIEQKGSYDTGLNLSVMSDLMHSELLDLDNDRYKQLQVSATFVEKEDHPLNGYVDAIAFTWGSPASVSKHRLKLSKLEGHCLLKPDDQSMQKLYLALNRGVVLKPEDWFALCANLAGEPQTSLAINLMNRLGERVKANGALWQGYLDYVRSRMTSKAFDLPGLAAVLNWLDTYKPEDSQLPDMVRLYWASARLAVANHWGRVSVDDARECFAIGNSLLQENAPAVCEADLRAAVACTNAFEFEAAANALQRWIGVDPAVPGLKAAAKIASSLGQHCAFMQEHGDAEVYFNQAIEMFSSLSDKTEAQREVQQTRAYQLIAKADAGEDDSGALTQALATYLEKDISKYINSGFTEVQGMRYQHHILLRLFVAQPVLFDKEIDLYLKRSAQWITAEHHPWPLINVYRGLLLAEKGQQKLAVQYCTEGVQNCLSSENTLIQWMGWVLKVLVQSAGVVINIELDDSIEKDIANNLPKAPLPVLKEWLMKIPENGLMPLPERIAYLQRCLPFNFH